MSEIRPASFRTSVKIQGDDVYENRTLELAHKYLKGALIIDEDYDDLCVLRNNGFVVFYYGSNDEGFECRYAKTTFYGLKSLGLREDITLKQKILNYIKRK